MTSAPEDRGMPGNSGGRSDSRKQRQPRKPGSEIRRLTEEDAERIVAEAYREAARIVNEAKRKAEHIVGETGDSSQEDYASSGDFARITYEQLDNLFFQMRYQLQALTQNDRVTAERLLELVNQLEYYVDSLVIDSLKLRNMRFWLRGTTEMARWLRAKLDRE